MTNNEKELLEIIRGCDDVEKALFVAIDIILEFLKQDELNQEQHSACHRVSA